MSDRRYLACVVVLVFLVALLCAPVVSSSRMLLRDDSIGQVDIDCMKGGGSQGDDDAWTDDGVGPPSDTHEKVTDEDRAFEEVRLTEGDRVTPILPYAILLRILFARLFVF